MRLHKHPEIPAAILLVGLAALHALLGAAGAGPQRALLGARAPGALPPAGSSARRDMEWCLRNVAIIHDVYWASACVVDAEEQRARRSACLAAHPGPGRACDTAGDPPDDSSDCTLPEPRARDLNAARARAEQQCFDQAARR